MHKGYTILYKLILIIKQLIYTFIGNYYLTIVFRVNQDQLLFCYCIWFKNKIKLLNNYLVKSKLNTLMPLLINILSINSININPILNSINYKITHQLSQTNNKKYN